MPWILFVSDLHSVKEVLSHDGGMKWYQYEMFAMVIDWGQHFQCSIITFKVGLERYFVSIY